MTTSRTRIATAIAITTSSLTAQPITLNAANVTYSTPEPTGQGSPTVTFTANPTIASSVLGKQGWYFRIDSDGDSQETAFGPWDRPGNWFDIRNRMAVTLDTQISSTGADSGLMTQTLGCFISSPVLPVDVTVFHFVDVALCGQVNVVPSSNGFSHIIESAICPSERVYISSPNADGWQVGAPGPDELTLGDGQLTTLTGSGLPFAGDYTLAFSWSFRLEFNGFFSAVMQIGHNDSQCPAACTNFGPAVPGFARIACNAPPAAGATGIADIIAGPPSAVGAMFLALDKLARPLPVLGGLIAVNPSSILTTVPLLLDPTGSASYSLPIPDRLDLCGFELFLQYVYLDTPPFLGSTDGLHWVVGQ